MAGIFYIGANSHVDLNAATSVDDRFKMTGDNTGNLLIGHAIKKQLKAEQWGRGFSTRPAHIEENFDCIVIGASNFLFKEFDFGYIADFLEKVNLPCIIIGLGAQAPNFSAEVNVHEGTQRLIRIISERSKSLGVRGYFTASVLEKIGIKNVRVLGCPSMYWRCKPTFDISKQDYRDDFRVSFNGSANVVAHAADPVAAERGEALLYRKAYEMSAPYVLQNEIVLMSMAADDSPESREKTGELIEQGVVRALKARYGLPELSDEEFVASVKKSMCTFFSVEEWMEYIRQYDFVVGSRFHGCMMALLNGVPATVMVHDARTREMCELFNIPHLDIAKTEDLDIRKIYELMDIEGLKSTYEKLYCNYIEFLQENNLRHNLELPESGDCSGAAPAGAGGEIAAYYPLQHKG